MPTPSFFETIADELLTETHGGRQSHSGGPTLPELTEFANEHHFHITSSTGGHHLGWAHKAGRAIDVRTRGQSASAINSMIRDAHRQGITVIDERRGGNSAWSGPHIHLQK
jgi:hypothetical protein